MPADIEKHIGFLAEKPAWWGGEHLVHHGKIYGEEALKLSGCDFEVKLAPAYLWIEDAPESETGKFVRVEGDFGTYRTLDDKAFKSGLSGGYTPVQTRDAISVLDNLVDSDQLQIETVLSLNGGKKLVVTARRPDHILIAGETVDTYIVFVTTHDGTSATKVFTTNVRVVCANTLALALMGAERMYSVRHTRNALERLQMARDVLKMTFQYVDTLQSIGESLASQKMSDMEWFKLIDQLWPMPEEEGRARTVRGDTRVAVTEIYFDEDNLNDIRGTRWGALNAVIQYNDHEKKYGNQSSKFANLMAGAELPNKALEILTKS